MENPLIDYDSDRDRNSQKQMFTMDQGSNGKESFWFRHRHWIFGVAGIVLGCLLTICISYPFYSMGMDRIIKETCAPKNINAAQISERKSDTVVETSTEAPINITMPWDTLLQYVTNEDNNVKKFIEKYTNKTFTELASTKLTSMEIKNLIGNVMTACKGGQTEIQTTNSEISKLKNDINNISNQEAATLQKMKTDLTSAIGNLKATSLQGQKQVLQVRHDINGLLNYLYGMVSMANSTNFTWGDMPTLPPLPSSIPTIGTLCMKDCLAWQEEGGVTISGVQCINPDGQGEFNAYCDMDTDSGGWTVFQRRVDGTVDFFRGWDDYENGFGNLTDEFWLGNKYIHRLTDKPAELRVDLKAWDNQERYAKFSSFSIDGASLKYRLHISGYSGTAGDALDYHDGHKFSTKDQDNSQNGGNCAKNNKGAWWYDYCGHSSLNGQYRKDGPYLSIHNEGINWEKFKGDRYSLKQASMMLRRKG